MLADRKREPRLTEIDGSAKGGSGTILRTSVAMSAITGQELHIYNIRQNRPQPGLKPQHLEAVMTAAKLCNAQIKGANVDSRELWFKPREITGGNVEAEIGTAGSIPMLLMTVLPICAFAKEPVRLHVSRGGTDVSHSPTVNYLRYVFCPMLRRMGLEVELTVQKYGYYPKGGGEATAAIAPCNSLRSLRLEEFGSLKTVKGISVCTFLAERRVAQRQADAATAYLTSRGHAPVISVVNDVSNPMQKGSSMALWAETTAGIIVGADAIGELRKTSEAVGTEAAEKLHAEILARPTVDVHCADMLIPYMTLAQGRSVFLTRTVSTHLETNIWVAKEMLNTEFAIEKKDGLYRVEKTR